MAAASFAIRSMVHSASFNFGWVTVLSVKNDIIAAMPLSVEAPSSIALVRSEINVRTPLSSANPRPPH